MAGKITVVPIDGDTLRVSCGDASVDIDLSVYKKSGAAGAKPEQKNPAAKDPPPFDPTDPGTSGILPYLLIDRPRSVTFARVSSFKQLPFATKQVAEHVRVAAPGRGKRLIVASMAGKELDLHGIQAAMKDTPADTHLIITMRGRK